MLQRVLETLLSSSSIGRVFLSGPVRDKLERQEGINKLIRSGKVSWSPPLESPSSSAYQSLSRLDAEQRTLLTTADHPLLTPEIVDDFCTKSAAVDADLVIGLAPYSLVRVAFPEMKKTILRFRGLELCGCNLFAFMTSAGREGASFWRRIESQRKSPLRVIQSMGWFTVIKYLLGLLSLDEALDTFSRRLGLTVRAVILPYADAAVDVDSVSDYRLVQARFDNPAPDRALNSPYSVNVE